MQKAKVTKKVWTVEVVLTKLGQTIIFQSFCPQKSKIFRTLFMQIMGKGSRLCAKSEGDQEGVEVVLVTVVPPQLLIRTPDLHIALAILV